jgi:hypothetical protein
VSKSKLDVNHSNLNVEVTMFGLAVAQAGSHDEHTANECTAATSQRTKTNVRK